MITNYLFFLQDFLGRNEIKKSVLSLNRFAILDESNYFKQNYITNPILKIFHKSSTLKNDEISFNIDHLEINQDLFEFKFTSHLVQYLKKELSSNESYKKEVTRSMLSTQRGVFYSRFNELIVGGFLKNQGFSIVFSSSKDKGKADIIAKMRKSKFSHEAKLYDSKEFQLIEKINLSAEAIIKFLSRIKDQEVFMFVKNMPDDFSKELGMLGSLYLKDDKKMHGNERGISIMKTPPFYIGTEGFVVDYLPTNSRLRIKPEFDMSISMDKLQESINKAETQFKNKEGVIWVTFPFPKEFSMEIPILLNLTEIPKKLKNSKMQLFIYELMPRVNAISTELKTRINILNNRSEFDFVNKINFNQFIEEIFKSPTFLLP